MINPLLMVLPALVAKKRRDREEKTEYEKERKRIEKEKRKEREEKKKESEAEFAKKIRDVERRNDIISDVIAMHHKMIQSDIKRNMTASNMLGDIRKKEPKPINKDSMSLKEIIMHGDALENRSSDSEFDEWEDY